MLAVTVIRTVPFQNAGLISLQIRKQISVPRCFDLFFCYISLDHPSLV